MVLTMAAQAFAADCRNRIALVATDAGVAIDASGTAEVRAQGTQQRFKVGMDARVADGTTFEVRVNGNSGAGILGDLAGTITITLGVGELGLNNNNDATLPTGVDPVCSIGAVQVGNFVTDLNGNSVFEPVLTGSF